MNHSASFRSAGPGPGPTRAPLRDPNYAFVEGPRAVAEIASLAAAAPYLAMAPRGDGHPVLVLPGYGGADGSTTVIRRYLAGQGLRSEPWRLGRNGGFGMANLRQRLAARLHQVWREADGRAVSLVGWSMGGVYARLLAKAYPDRVRQVITLGSPIGGMAPGPAALPVPATAVYSRTDGIVPWQIARVEHADGAENVEVYGSHIGLGFNAAALYLLADRLAQPADGWRPFQRSGWKTWVYGSGRH